MFRKVNGLAALALVWAWAGVAAGEGVVAWYEFEGTTLDSSGHGRNGTMVGVPTYGPGVNGQAIGFPGTAEGVDLGVLPITSAFTVSFWANFGSDHSAWLVSQMDLVGGNWYGWVLKTNLQSGQYVPLFQVGNGTPVRVSFYDTTFTTLWDMYNPDNPDVWHHLAATHDGVSTARVYLNGQLYAQKTDIPYAPATTSTAYIRRPGGYSPGPDNMDDVLILGRAMDAGEIAELYDQGVTWPLGVSPGNDQALIALKDSPAPGPVSYQVYNDDGGATRTIDIAEVDSNGTATDYAWLSLSTTQIVDLAASSKTTVAAIIDHSTTAPGVYTAYVAFSTGTRTVTRQIQLTVLGCQWAITPASLGRYYLDGSGDSVAPVVYTVTNTGKHGLTYTVQEVVDQSWLTLDKSGSASPLNYQATDAVTATIDPAGLALGRYTCDLRIANNCNPADEFVHTVTLNVEEAIVGPGLLAYYRFEDSGRDWTGHGWNGTPSGTPAYDEGRYGRAIKFDGPAGSLTGDGMDLGDIPGGSEMSVALWFRSTTRHKAWLVNKITSAGGPWKGWQIKNYLEWQGLDWETPVLRFTWCHDGLRDSLNTSNPNADIAVPNLYDGNWHLIVMTIEDIDGELGDQANVRGYYDGLLLEGENIWTQNPGLVRFERLNTEYVPAPDDVNVWVSGDVDRVLGGVDELSFWNRALTADEVAYLYANGFIDTRLWPDPDEDGDVDMHDFAIWQRCSTGSGGAIADTANCGRFDRDKDNDIDESDFRQFENCATGPSVPLDSGNLPVGCEL